MAGFSVLWRVLGMAGWDKYFYCTNCGRPYRESETKLREFVVHPGKRYAYRITVNHCVYCSEPIGQPQNSVGLHVLGFAMFCVAAFYWGFVDSRSDIIMRDLFFVCPMLGGMCIWVNHQQKSKHKPIYDHWVMEHGTDHQKWPGASKSE